MIVCRADGVPEPATQGFHPVQQVVTLGHVVMHLLGLLLNPRHETLIISCRTLLLIFKDKWLYYTIHAYGGVHIIPQNPRTELFVPTAAFLPIAHGDCRCCCRWWWRHCCWWCWHNWQRRYLGRFVGPWVDRGKTTSGIKVVKVRSWGLETTWTCNHHHQGVRQ